MPSRIVRGSLALVIAGLSGCATLSEEECAMSDWHTIGFEDGSRGYTADRLGDHRRACAGGGQYHGVCAPELEPEFLDAYRAGRELHNLRSGVSSANSRIQARQHALEETKEQIRDKEAALIAEETTSEERVLLLADLKELAEQAGEIETEIDLLIDERARNEERLAAYEALLAQSGY
jgi:hypothetical protein